MSTLEHANDSGYRFERPTMRMVLADMHIPSSGPESGDPAPRSAPVPSFGARVAFGAAIAAVVVLLIR